MTDTIVAAEASAETAYDRMLYPTGVMPHLHPERLALAAHLHGLSPAPIATARVLEIGGGDGLNQLAFAAGHPRAHVVNFDLAAVPVAKGRSWAERAGLVNADICVLDILEAIDAIDGTFDYIVAHGVYAWVPDHVRAAIFPLIAAKLAPGGVAMVSFNAYPGCYLRLALRDMLLLETRDIADPRDRIASARAMLTEFAAESNYGKPGLTALHDQAEVLLKRADGHLIHDELGESYHPQHFQTVVDAARSVGLAWLGDVGIHCIADGFLPPEIDLEPDIHLQAEARQVAQDYRQLAFFRNLTFVKAGAGIQRRLNPERVAGLFASTLMRRNGPDEFVGIGQRIRITEPVLARFLDALIAAAPARVRVGDLSDNSDLWLAAFKLFDGQMIDLHFDAEGPHAVTLSDRPEVPALVRALIADGSPEITSLDHRLITIGHPGTRAVIAALDGTRTVAELKDVARAAGITDEVQFEQGLKSLLQQRVLLG